MMHPVCLLHAAEGKNGKEDEGSGGIWGWVGGGGWGVRRPAVKRYADIGCPVSSRDHKVGVLADVRPVLGEVPATHQTSIVGIPPTHPPTHPPQHPPRVCVCVGGGGA